MYSFGAQFNYSVSLNYTRIELYASEPKLIGNYTQLMGDPLLKIEAIEFYNHFQKRTDYLKQASEVFDQMFNKKQFILYYNRLYWNLTLNEPVVRFTYTKVALPGQPKNE